MKTEKVSLTLPAHLLKEARKYAGERGLSHFAAEGLEQRILTARQGDFIRDWEAEFGALTEDEIGEAREWLRG